MVKKPKHQTTNKGAEIPIPKRADFFNNLKKAAATKAPGRKKGNK